MVSLLFILLLFLFSPPGTKTNLLFYVHLHLRNTTLKAFHAFQDFLKTISDRPLAKNAVLESSLQLQVILLDVIHVQKEHLTMKLVNLRVKVASEADTANSKD